MIKVSSARWKIAAFTLTLTALIAACIRNGSNEVQLRFDYRPRTIAAAALTCIAVNIVGEGIPSQNPENGEKNLPAALAGDHCSYPGVTTKLVPRSSAGVFELKVPPGKNRLIQVFGIESTQGCPDVSLGEILTKAKMPNALPVTYGGIYEAGRLVTDFVKTTTITVPNFFDGNNPKDYKTCATAGTNNLSFGTTATTIHVGGKVALSVSGGSGGNTFQVVSGGGNIASAIYTAPTSGGTAVIQATDSQGNQKQHSISIFKAGDVDDVISWHIADLVGKPDNYQLASGDALPERSGSAYVGDLGYSADTVNYRMTDGPNGTPTILFAGGYLVVTGTSFPSTSSFDAYLVGKATATAGHHLCMTASTNCTGLSTYFRISSDSANFFTELRTGSMSVVTSSSLTDGGDFQIHEFRLKTLTDVEFNVGNQNDAPTSALSNNLAIGGGGKFFLGSEGNGFGFSGSISEVLIYKTGLSNSQRNQVLGYLADKYKLTKPN